MKVKTIKSVLSNKMNDWLSSIEDDGVKDIIKHNSIITGGCIASMLLKEPINDFDVYFKTREAAIEVAQYYVQRFKIKKKSGIECKIMVDTSQDDRIRIMVKSAGIASEEGTDRPYQYFESAAEGEAGEYVERIINDPADIEDAYEETKEAVKNSPEEDGKPRYRPIFLSTNAITLSNKMQLVFRFYGKPDEIHANYDYVHCTNYWTSWNTELVLRQPALEALLARELFYVGSKYPVCSVFRLRKFMKRGWTINAGQIVKMAMQISALDLTKIEVLQDQLTGVDCAYFMEVIHDLKSKDPVKVNYAYLVEILDRMF